MIWKWSKILRSKTVSNWCQRVKLVTNVSHLWWYQKWLKNDSRSKLCQRVKLVSNWCQRVKLVSKWCQMWVICDDTKNGWKMNQDQNCVRVSKRVSNVCQMWWHQKMVEKMKQDQIRVRESYANILYRIRQWILIQRLG